MQKKIILVLLFALVVAVFAIQNASAVTIKIFQWQDQVSLAFVIIGSIAFGALIMGVVTSFTQLKMAKNIKSLKKDKEELEEEIEQLHEEVGELSEKNLDLKDDDILSESDNEDIEDK